MYSTIKAKEFANTASKFMTAGIHDDVTFESAKIDKSPNGNLFIEAVFSKNKQTFKHTEWEPTKYGNDTDETLDNKINGQILRFGQILNCFYDEVEEIEVSNFSEYGKWLVDKLNNADKTKLVRLKIVYNKKGFTTLPSYNKYTWIESMSVEKSAIEKRADDLFIRPIQPDAIPFVNNSFETNADPNALPFM